ncbi:unnamed protein product [Leptidea sinapis]|uniref:Uncharacterized protein n=1 Tax=Leptidea sinapis TaxID=189913 RepID=A0A5E4QCJ0_9NEOP|nr:unnamed protein product [Leptidea sinapis]
MDTIVLRPEGTQRV